MVEAVPVDPLQVVALGREATRRAECEPPAKDMRISMCPGPAERHTTRMGTITAALSGVFMALQGAMNAQLSRTLGLYWMLVAVQLLATGSALVLALWRTPHLPPLLAPPAYLYLAGPLGVAITALVALSVPRLGMVRTTTFIVVAQVLAAVLIDHLGILGLASRPFPAWRLVGVALLAFGAQILLRA